MSPWVHTHTVWAAHQFPDSESILIDILHTWDILNVNIIFKMPYEFFSYQGVAFKYKLGNPNQRKKHLLVDAGLMDLQCQNLTIPQVRILQVI